MNTHTQNFIALQYKGLHSLPSIASCFSKFSKGVATALGVVSRTSHLSLVAFSIDNIYAFSTDNIILAMFSVYITTTQCSRLFPTHRLKKIRKSQTELIVLVVELWFTCFHSEEEATRLLYS